MVADDSSREGIAEPKVPRNPISRRQIETVVSRSSAVFGLAFGAQTFPVLLEQVDQLVSVWFVVVSGAVYGGLLAAVIASVARRGVSVINSFVAIAWFVAMATWPLAVAGSLLEGDARPWPWFILTVATAAAAVAWPVWAATIAVVVAPLAYGAVRIAPSGGGVPIELAALDVLYAVILGGTVMIIITLLRQAAASVDLAQSTALDRYSIAVGQHATEVERVQVDAIVHDSVLTTLISAARADTPDAEALAARMATDAMGYLREAASSSPDHATVPMTQLAARIRGAASTLAASFEIRAGDIVGRDVPAQAAEAVYSASVQAMVNSAQHAGSGPAVARWVGIRCSDSAGIAVEVGDTGAGFDVFTVPTERIGLRVSIIDRVDKAGGHVDVDSHPGEGTVVTISWPNTPTLPGSVDAYRGVLRDRAAGAALPTTITDSEQATP